MPTPLSLSARVLRHRRVESVWVSSDLGGLLLAQGQVLAYFGLGGGGSPTIWQNLN